MDYLEIVPIRGSSGVDVNGVARRLHSEGSPLSAGIQELVMNSHQKNARRELGRSHGPSGLIIAKKKWGEKGPRRYYVPGRHMSNGRNSYRGKEIWSRSTLGRHLAKSAGQIFLHLVAKTATPTRRAKTRWHPPVLQFINRESQVIIMPCRHVPLAKAVGPRSYECFHEFCPRPDLLLPMSQVFDSRHLTALVMTCLLRTMPLDHPSSAEEDTPDGWKQ